MFLSDRTGPHPARLVSSLLSQLVAISNAVERAQTAEFSTALLADAVRSQATPHQSTRGGPPRFGKINPQPAQEENSPELVAREIVPQLTEPFVAWCVSRHLKERAGLFLSASMPCRDLDTFADTEGGGGGGVGVGEGGDRQAVRLGRVRVRYIYGLLSGQRLPLQSSQACCRVDLGGLRFRM